MWDRVFDDVETTPPVRPEARLEQKRMPRKQTMTAREISAFDDMFSMIFNAVAEQKSSPEDVSIGGQQGTANDIFGTLRKHSKRIRWTKDADVELDRKKEQMGRCETDHELLEWAMKEVFEESTTLEEKSRQSLSEFTEVAQDAPMLQSPTYPHIIALLISTFRDKYNDPHLALSIFNHAKRLSVPSYVFGCTTMAYNELIETRWTCFRDLKGVYDALIEMTVNGVDIDSRTRKLVEGLRSDIGATALWLHGDSMNQSEVWEMLSKVEELVRGKSSQASSSQAEKPTKWDDWKTMDFKDEASDPWGFDRWEEEAPPVSRRRERRGGSRNEPPRKLLTY